MHDWIEIHRNVLRRACGRPCNADLYVSCARSDLLCSALRILDQLFKVSKLTKWADCFEFFFFFRCLIVHFVCLILFFLHLFFVFHWRSCSCSCSFRKKIMAFFLIIPFRSPHSIQISGCRHFTKLIYYFWWPNTRTSKQTTNQPYSYSAPIQIGRFVASESISECRTLKENDIEDIFRM